MTARSKSPGRRVAIIGAGITGLSAANRLRELGDSLGQAIEVAVLERATRVGGPLETIRRDGFVIETGADSFLTEKPWAAALARRIGLREQLISTRAEYRRTFVVRRGQLMPIPDGFSMLAPTHLGPVFKSPLFSAFGKLRIALEPFVPTRASKSDESLASFVMRRLGRQVLDRVAQPLAGGIYTADPARLSMAATMPRFVDFEHRYGSVIRGLQSAERKRDASGAGLESGARWSLFQSFANGAASLPETLADRLGNAIRTGAEVVAMSWHGAGWRLSLGDGVALDADAVICAAPASAAARILAQAAPKAAHLIGAINYATAATVNLTYRAGDFSRTPQGFGFVVPVKERRKIIAGSFSSSKFEGRAPAGSMLLRAFVGGVLQSEMMRLTDDEIVAAVQDEFRALLGVTAQPGIAIVRRWPDSMPQYEVGHLERVDEIERLTAPVPAFALAGAAYRGVGIPDCVHSGEQAAEGIFNELSASS